jgi:glycosyltransferase involved in cell wall biosynthesis
MTVAHPIDVLLPVRNGEKYIVHAIRSIQHQTVESWRLLVLDDGSTDNTVSMVETSARGDSRIVLVRRPPQGLVATLNAGLELCEAEFFARQDADDISLPDRFEFQLKYLRDHPECAVVSGTCFGIDEKGTRLDRVGTLPPQDQADPYWIPAREPYVMHGFSLSRRKAVQKVGGYRHFFHCEDVDLCWRLAENWRLVSLPQMVGEYRLHPDSVSTASTANARIQQIFRSLAAVAARRRRERRGDIDVEPQLHDRLVHAGTIEGMLELLRDRLDAEELHYVRCAAIMRLFETFLFRPFNLELSDVQCAAQVLKALPPCSQRNRAEIAMTIGRTVRLLRKRGETALARELAPDGSSLLYHLEILAKAPEADRDNLRT